MLINLELEMYVKSVEIYDTYISFGVPIESKDSAGNKSPVIWFNFFCTGIAYGKLKERGIQSGDKVHITRCFPKVRPNGKLQWCVLDVE